MEAQRGEDADAWRFECGAAVDRIDCDARAHREDCGDCSAEAVVVDTAVAASDHRASLQAGDHAAGANHYDVGALAPDTASGEHQPVWIRGIDRAECVGLLARR